MLFGYEQGERLVFVRYVSQLIHDEVSSVVSSLAKISSNTSTIHHQPCKVS
jgi:hypothetical protein